MIFMKQIVTNDRNREFHPFGLAVCTRKSDYEFLSRNILIGLNKLKLPKMEPQALKADGSDAIRNALMEVFNCKAVVMCWVLTLSACKKDIVNKSKEMKEE